MSLPGMQVLLPLSLFGETNEVLVQDSAALAEPGEELSFWQLQVSGPHSPSPSKKVRVVLDDKLHIVLDDPVLDLLLPSAT